MSLRAVIRALCHRAVYECSRDFVSARLEGFSKRLGQGHGLDDEALQFRKNRRLMIGAVMLLIADALNGDESTALQA
jgi:hypothetical protein